jgi:hypothetical protein
MYKLNLYLYHLKKFIKSKLKKQYLQIDYYIYYRHTLFHISLLSITDIIIFMSGVLGEDRMSNVP